ncbi:TrbG/VirB9 family P-type conjugative transfer protein [Muricoccus pecuniae]|uniref:Type IV secretion system protein VirB9 n=1 Tax=Muricoccus pecuniae TaxID=693023 RepID=A0A840YLM8_9PROT|nr:TrbG/VirB9 family P-type conjugative transfer protein [Roseomonas pecuniae]MBB5696052.1 type IV secretion system protein VirB9 [Roseomonas pecuniae]
MSRALTLALGATLSLPGPVLAAETPAPCGPDPRERCVAFSPGQIVRIYAAPGATLAIELPAAERVAFVGTSDNQLLQGGEAVERVAAGGDGSSTADPNLMTSVPRTDGATGNFVMIKPLRHLEPQPFTVLAWWVNPTNQARELRRHTFELRTRPGELTEDVPDTFFAVRFSDPVGERIVAEAERRAVQKEASERWAAQRAEREQRAAAARLVQAAALGTTRQNTAYDGQGTATDRTALAPAPSATAPAIWDDGQRTYLRYPGNRRPPMPYQVLADGTEAVVGQSTNPDPTTNGNILVLHGVFPMLRLRDGDNVLCIVNRAYDPTGQNPGTGTVSPDVLRVSRSTPQREAPRAARR